MEIIVYTKQDCDLCASFKDKLRNHLKVPFDERDLQQSLQLSDTWREDGTDRLAAAHAYLHGAVPMILIDRYAYDYARAFKEIKKRLAAGEEATMPEAERDKSMDRLGPPLSETAFVEAVRKLCDGHIELMTVTSPVERTYCVNDESAGRCEVQGDIEVWMHYRDPTAKPLCTVELKAEGQDFRGVLRSLSAKIESAKQDGHIWSGKRGVPDGHAATEGQAGGDRGEEKRPDGA